MNILPLTLAELIQERNFSGIWALIISKIPILFACIVIIIVGFSVSNFIGKLSVKAMTARGVDSSIHSFIKTIITLVLKLSVVLSALSTLGVNINSFIAALGAAGVTAGIGLQTSIGQFASGVEILINKPFKSGDYIELENVSGKVLEIKLMYTVLITLDNKRVIVPNSHITSNNIINNYAESKRRLDLVYSVSYSADIAKVKEVLAQVIACNELIFTDPEPRIAVKEHGSSAIKITCLVWFSTEDYWDVFYYMQEAVKLAFDREGITIPFDQLDVHISKE